MKDTTEPKIETKSVDQDDENNIDLDTLIAMMFKETSFGAAPPFLQLDDSESKTDKEDRTTDTVGGATDNSILEKIKTEMNVENSMDSMMHIASEAISNDSVSMKSNSIDGAKVKQEKKIIEDGTSDISSDDEVLESCTPPPLPSGSKASSSIPPPPPTTTMAGDIKLDDDKMSLSSLSSTEEKSNNRKAITSDVDSHKNVVPSMPEYYYPPTALNNPYYYPNGENATMYDPYSGMQTHGYMQPYMGGGFPPIIPGNYVQSTEYPPTATTKSQQHGSSSDPIASNIEPKKDPSERIVSAAIERVKTELKQILKKDFNKRMIESIAFKKYEAWWDEQVQNKTKSSTTAAYVFFTEISIFLSLSLSSHFYRFLYFQFSAQNQLLKRRPKFLTSIKC